MANKLVIEIRHAAAAKASAEGNTDSNATAPDAPPNTVSGPPAATKPAPDENKTAAEAKPATAQEQLTRTWSKAQVDARKRFAEMHAKKK